MESGPPAAFARSHEKAMSIRRVVPNIQSERIDESRKFYTGFLGFDVAREKYNPDVIFQPEEKKTAAPLLVRRSSQKTFSIAWRQYSDFWRDERLLYRGQVPNLCMKRE